MGWPKGVPRGPRKAKLPQEQEKGSARYDPDAVPFVAQPVVASGFDPELEAVAVAQKGPEKAKRRRRRVLVGVRVGRAWYPAVSGRWERGGATLVLSSDDGREWWLPVDWRKPIECRGVALPPIAATFPAMPTLAELPLATSGPRVVDIADHMDVDPRREQNVREHYRGVNAELAELTVP